MFAVLVRVASALLFWAALAGAQQTLTTTNDAGTSIVIVITTDAQGLPLTQTIQTLNPAQGPAQATPPAPEGGGPVAQPGPTPTAAGAPTPYTYTTTDAQGEYTAVAAVFTPVFVSAPLRAPTGTGTVLAYDDWLKLIGTNTLITNTASQFVVPSVLVGLGTVVYLLCMLRLV